VPRHAIPLALATLGSSEAQVRQWLAERSLSNVELVVGCRTDMASQYRQAHVTLAPFTDITRSKPVPNSLIESLACGRPVVTSELVGLANLIRTAQAGRVCAVTGEALADELRRLRAEWARYSGNARVLAEEQFGIDRFLAAYERVYADVLAGTTS